MNELILFSLTVLLSIWISVIMVIEIAFTLHGYTSKRERKQRMVAVILWPWYLILVLLNK